MLKIEKVSNEDVFDMTIPETSAFFANDILVHNCAEISLRSNQFCNLTTINASKIRTQEDFNECARVAAFIGTLQASYTNFHYLRSKWRAVTEKEALLGVSITGIANEDFLTLNEKEAADIATKENERVSDLIGINKAARVTTVKPEGTSSSLLGTSSGIHAWHNKYYLRRARLSKSSPVYLYFFINHPEMVEDEFYNPKNSAIVSFPIKADEGSIVRTEPALDLLRRTERFQKNWVKPGHRSGKNRNNVSLTVSVRPNEWAEVGEFIFERKNDFTGISVLPYDGGSYIQAPFEDLTKEEYEKLLESVTQVDLTQVIEETNNTTQAENLACVGLNCTI